MKRPFRKRRLAKWLRRGGDVLELFGITTDDVDELLIEARRRLEKGDLDAAERLFGVVMFHLEPGDALLSAFLGRGACRQTRGDLAGARFDYLAVASARPGDPFALANLAEVVLLGGDISGARGFLAAIDLAKRADLNPVMLERIERLNELAKASNESIVYSAETKVSPLEFLDLLDRSTLAERRPIDEPSTIAGMLGGADVLVTARVEGELVGISRAITDRSYCTYLSDLAVDREFQKRGIGRELIRRTHEAAGLNTTLILLAAPAAREYYPHIGMQAHDSCWIIPRTRRTD